MAIGIVLLGMVWSWPASTYRCSGQIMLTGNLEEDGVDLKSREKVARDLQFFRLIADLDKYTTQEEKIRIAPDNMGMEMLMNMFGGLGSGGLGGVPNRSNVPPEELYATQLAQLQDMGFFDTQENIRALVATAGNVHAAVERLLGNLGQ